VKLLGSGIVLAAAFAVLPLLTMRSDLLNLCVQIFLAVVMAQSWNLLGGYAGQINLGHAAFFGVGGLVSRTLWVGGTPLILALFTRALVAKLFGFLIGVPALRLSGA
jgi:branched-chain amino acid transport system permease protein